MPAYGGGDHGSAADRVASGRGWGVAAPTSRQHGVGARPPAFRDHPAEHRGFDPATDRRTDGYIAPAGQSLGRAFCDRATGRIERCAGTRSQAVAGRRGGQASGGAGGDAATSSRALELPHDGAGRRHLGGERAAAVGRHDIKPHLSRTFKLSNDKQFEEKFWDVIGLYLDPPDKALVLCCDEKSQCQALERTQPGLPLGMGHIKTRTHDYIRHGTLTLFAALNYLDGKILSQTAPRHTHRQWLGFLKHLDQEAPAELTLHLIIDN